jgi:hypothetical protein
MEIGDVYTNIKNKKNYVINDFAVNKTNAQYNQKMVIYSPGYTSKLYTKSLVEFKTKFKLFKKAKDII